SAAADPEPRRNLLHADQHRAIGRRQGRLVGRRGVSHGGTHFFRAVGFCLGVRESLAQPASPDCAASSSAALPPLLRRPLRGAAPVAGVVTTFAIASAGINPRSLLILII